MLKKNGGITLIALVVTIIVLLILAGITIAMLTGNNGIITRTNDSKVNQIEGQVYEEIKLAVQSAKIFATQKSIETQGGGWFASMNIDKRSAQAISDDTEGLGVDHTAGADIIAVLREDLTTARGYSKISGSNATVGLITVTYTTGDYEAATNYKTANIVAKIKVDKNKFEIKAVKATRGTSDIRYIVGNDEVFASPLE